mmetsp:Transcript_8215/g.10301  ORF Transcript_8215/g.10301 Transcript_8215/m.10301 type:complete len:85 (+) Transcript_8215:113-367(+)
MLTNFILATVILNYAPSSRSVMVFTASFKNFGNKNRISNPRYAMPNLSMIFLRSEEQRGDTKFERTQICHVQYDISTPPPQSLE